MGWTRQQQQAININNCNLLVSAAAGSGKTAVLTQRIVDKVSTDIDVDRLLIITFTKAAAAEMRQRISEAIARRLDAEEGDVQRLIRQQALMSKASICTIDSFCKQVVMKNFTVSEVDSSFSIGDEDELGLLQQELFEEMLEEYYQEGNPDFCLLADCFSDKSSDEMLKNAILSVYRFIFTLPDPFEWLKDAVNMYSMDFTDTPWCKELIKYAVNVSYDCKRELEALLEASVNYTVPKITDALTGDLEDCKNLYDFLTEKEHSWQEIGEYLSIFKFRDLSRKKTGDDPDALEKFRKNREKIKSKIKEITELFTGYTVSPMEQVQNIRPCIEMLQKLIVDFHGRYSEAKTQRKLLSFSDIEHLALKVLRVPSVAEEYRNRYIEIYVDEYQDTNMLQEAIVTSISRGNNLFMVGDVKQSIYAFRQACPELFTEKEEGFESPEKYQNDGPGCVVKLSANFRSRSQVVDSVNNIFQRIMNKSTCNVAYSNEDSLHYSASYFDESDNKEDYIPEILVCQGKLDEEFSMIGRRIRKLVDEKFQVYDKDLQTTRNIKYSDIAILSRKIGGKASSMVKCLQSYGIPCYAEEKGGFYEDYDVNVILSVVRIVDNPLQDLPLLTVLRSPLFNFDENTLAEIRINDRSALLFDSMLTMKNPSVTAFLEEYEKLKEQARNMSISGFIWMLITSTGYYDYIGKMPEGSRRQANLRLLFDRAVAYENSGKRSFFRFINHIERLQQKESDAEVASAVSEGMDAVSVLTIHKSKGLEYPVVFVSRAGESFGGGGNIKPPVELSRQLGLTMKMYNIETDLFEKSILQESMSLFEKRGKIAEEMRILYVAMTRAKEKLFITGNIKENEEFYLNNTTPSVFRVINASCYLDWIRMAGSSSCWKVITEDNDTDKIPEISAFQQVAEQSEQVVAQKIFWQYPYFGTMSLPSKMSVSEIKKRNLDEDTVVVLSEDTENINPFRDFSEKIWGTNNRRNFTGAEVGTVLHECLRRVDYSKCTDTERLTDVFENLTEEMVSKGIILPEEKNIVDPRLPAGFFLSDIGKRVLASKKVRREVPFTIVKEAGQLQPGTEGKVTIQGIIDCCFIEDGQYVIVDYKSDNVYGENISKRARSYKTQLDLYAEALERITGIKVKEKILFFLRPGVEVRV